MAAEKQCKACGIIKSLEDFYREGNSKDGHQGICRVCKREDGRLRRTGEIKPYVFNGVSQPCSRCGVDKSLDQFYKDKAFKNGYAGHCKECKEKLVAEWRAENRDRVNANHKAWINRVPGRARDRALRFHYGITSEDYEKMLVAQGGVCAICGSDDPKGNVGWKNGGSKRAEFFHVDHNHETGKVRGLLCANCNKALGCFQESEELLIKAVEYLKWHHLTQRGRSVRITRPHKGTN